MELKEAKNKLRRYLACYKRLPSYSEMNKIFNFASKRSSFELARKMMEKGILDKDESGKLIPGKRFFEIPILGAVKAGVPDEAYEQFLGSVSIEDYLVNNPEKIYALKVSGDSMINEGIVEGDIVLIEKNKEAKEGDVIVAEVDGAFTLKYLKRKNGKVYLEAANEKYKPIYPRENLNLFGVVVSVIRKYY